MPSRPPPAYPQPSALCLHRVLNLLVASLSPSLFAQRIEELSAEVREFVAVEDAKVIPVSAHTGYGLDTLRTTLAAALVQHSTPAATPPGRRSDIEASEGFGLETRRLVESLPASPEVPGGEGGSEAGVAGSEGGGLHAVEDARGEEVEVVMADSPEGAATATVLDYTSSAKTGKVLVSVRAGADYPP